LRALAMGVDRRRLVARQRVCRPGGTGVPVVPAL